MKRILFLILCLLSIGSVFGQAPQITGDLMLCPNTDGSASVVNQTYDTYQWYYKFWFSSDEYTAIPGANQSSFTYDWFTYDQSLFKVVATIDGQTFESNVIQINSYNWTPLLVFANPNEQVTFNPEGIYLLCPDGNITVEISDPFSTNIQWYKDGLPIDGATNMSYLITEPAIYHVVASPYFCPNSTNDNLGLPIIVEANNDCSLSVDDPTLNEQSVRLYPNPTKRVLNLDLVDNNKVTEYSIIDSLGKVLLHQKTQDFEGNKTQIDVSSLSSGLYLLRLSTEKGYVVKRFIKN